MRRAGPDADNSKINSLDEVIGLREMVENLQIETEDLAHASQGSNTTDKCSKIWRLIIYDTKGTDVASHSITLRISGIMYDKQST